ncbi:hypothetical protein E2C01_065294 [Portunus trituberculatus]|uniref:Uncharacterized protein n=1 Tax=Portunus trituberculatus TaxID=210409 RepID=A0A5B7HQP5_PORTR|nr:hypothetical protein [Portunus trituberculatus]
MAASRSPNKSLIKTRKLALTTRRGDHYALLWRLAAATSGKTSAVWCLRRSMPSLRAHLLSAASPHSHVYSV